MPVITSLEKKLYNTSTTPGQRDVEERYIQEIVNKLILDQTSVLTDESNQNNWNYLYKEIDKIVNNKELDVDKDYLNKRIKEKLFGYDILEDYIHDEDISDIDFTRYNYGTYKIKGVKKKMPISFNNKEDFQRFCKLIIIRNGGMIDENNAHWRVADEKNKLRINVTIPPRNRTGCSLIIRKHRQNPYDLNDLVKLKMLTPSQKNLLINYINKDKNVLICGKGASGKTTLLRALLMEINQMKTILICEKDTELYMDDYYNFISQKIKKAEEGGKEVTLKNLIQDGLTMSLDGYCIGELIGEETWDFINAGYTDHNIYGTVHARSPEDALDRLLAMINMSEVSLSETTVKKIIANSIDVIVYLKNFKLNSMSIVKGYDCEKNRFRFVRLEK